MKNTQRRLTTHRNKKARCDYTKTAKILVGPARHEFNVHIAGLSAVSPFFATAFSGDWAESHDRSMMLPGDDVKMFQAFLCWMYTSEIFIPDHGRYGINITLLIQLYIFSDKVQAMDCKEAVVRYLYEGIQKLQWVPGKACKLMNDHMDSLDGLYTLILHWHVKSCPAEAFTGEAAREAPYFAAAVLRQFAASCRSGPNKHYQPLDNYVKGTRPQPNAA